jgi:(p)ppGpp synthase/HD superfamily hydrolase
MRVAGMLSLIDLPIVGDDMIAAAWLHDVYEDTPIKPTALSQWFGNTVGQLVEELTNRYTSEAYPDMKRKKRKAAEVRRLADVSPEAQFIKLCDRIDNLHTINDKGKKFSLLYCDESEALTEVLVASPTLQLEIFKITRSIRKALK